jgi:hypothetical protein
MTASSPPELKVLEENVGGSDGKIDAISTLDEGEKFWNFDQVDDDEDTGQKEHAVSMFFYENAEVDKVKAIYWGPPQYIIRGMTGSMMMTIQAVGSMTRIKERVKMNCLLKVDI